MVNAFGSRRHRHGRKCLLGGAGGHDILQASVAFLLPVLSLSASDGLSVVRELATAKDRALATCDTLRYELAGAVDELLYDLNAAREANLVEDKTYGKVRTRLEAIRSEVMERTTALARGQEAFFRKLESSLGGNRLSIENIEQSPELWFMLSEAEIRLGDGTAIRLEPTDFAGGTGYRVYAYKCPPAKAVWIYGKSRGPSKMHTRFFLECATKQEAELRIRGQDADKPGVTRIRILLNGREIFRGPNGFAKQGWSERRFRLPGEALVFGGARDIRTKLGAHSEALRRDANELRHRCTAALHPLKPLIRPLQQKVPRVTPPRANFYRNAFIRGVYYHGIMPNVSLVVKSLRDARCNLILSYLTRSSRAGQSKPSALEELLSRADRAGIPIVEAVLPEKKGWDFLHPERIEDRLLSLLSPWRSKHPSLVGVEFDEPGGWDRAFEEEEAYRAFADFLRGKPRVARELGTVPTTVKPPTQTAQPPDPILWVEWQLFKIETMRRYFAQVNLFCKERGLLLCPIIVGCPATRPQHASFSTLPAVLDIIAQGSYKTSTLNLTFLLELLRANARDRTYLCAGSGYSAPTPRAHELELSVAIPHSNGIWLWCWLHQQPYWFAKSCSKPGLWEVTHSVFRKVARIERFLVNSHSTARIALLYSERTGIVDSYGRPYGFQQPYYLNQLGWYWALISVARQCDIVFAEGLTAERAQRYRVLIVSDARALTPEQISTIRDWTENGGTLVATADTSLADEWGRARDNYALADLFGVRYLLQRTGAPAFRIEHDLQGVPAGACVAYDSHLPYALVEPTTATVLARWEDGAPALTENRFGKGKVLFLTARHFGLDYEGERSTRKLPGRFLPGVLRLVRALVADAPHLLIRTTAADGIEICIRKQPDRYLIHLLNHGEARTVRGLTITLRIKGQSGWEAFYPSDYRRTRVVKVDRHTIKLRVRDFRVYELVVLESRS